MVRPFVLVSTTLALALVVAGCTDQVNRSPSPVPLSASPPPSSAPDTTSPTQCTQADAIDRWPLRQLATQVLVAPAQFSDVGASSTDVAQGVGGLILFGATPAADFTTSLERMTSAAPRGIPPLVMTDEEGGAVQRAQALVGPVPSARRMARSMTAQQIESLGYDVGTKLRAAGITMDLAPVLDLDNRRGPSATNPDGTRSFGMDVARASAAGIAFAKGLERAGVIPVVKHFPGLGYATGNTDNGPAQTVPWDTLASNGLAPFHAAVRVGIPAVMVANASVPGLTRQPASISPTVINRVLRDSLQFNGLVMTDSVSALALRDAGYSVPEAAVAALAAGADLVLFGTGQNDDPRLVSTTATAIVKALRSGTLPRARLEAAVAQVLAVKNIKLCSSP